MNRPEDSDPLGLEALRSMHSPILESTKANTFLRRTFKIGLVAVPAAMALLITKTDFPTVVDIVAPLVVWSVPISASIVRARREINGYSDTYAGLKKRFPTLRT